MKIKKENFGSIKGKEIYLFTLTNNSQISVGIINYGAIILFIKTPDKNGTIDDIVLGYDSLKDYIKNPAYFGAVIGRFCNRIQQGKFSLNSTEYSLAQNDGSNHLHGGIEGFDKKVWAVAENHNETFAQISFSYFSIDGEERYPGNLAIEVKYTLDNSNALSIEYFAKNESDKATIVNLTNHSYFNLKGAGIEDVLEHQLMINADSFLPIDDTYIPEGKIQPVLNTAMDFTTFKTIGADLKSEEVQIQKACGYDHNFIIKSADNNLCPFAAQVYEPTKGRLMTVQTTQPGIQFYSGNFLNNILGKNKKIYRKHYGFCLETQHFPDSPNHLQFPTTILQPKDLFFSKTRYIFSHRDKLTN
jgi:aldose 1-epimerase